MKNKQSLWNDMELQATLNLYYYLEASSQKISAKNKMVINTANSIKRSVNAVVMRLGNYRYWESNGLEGLSNGGPNAKNFWLKHRI